MRFKEFFDDADGLICIIAVPDTDEILDPPGNIGHVVRDLRRKDPFVRYSHVQAIERSQGGRDDADILDHTRCSGDVHRLPELHGPLNNQEKARNEVAHHALTRDTEHNAHNPPGNEQTGELYPVDLEHGKNSQQNDAVVDHFEEDIQMILAQPLLERAPEMDRECLRDDDGEDKDYGHLDEIEDRDVSVKHRLKRHSPASITNFIGTTGSFRAG